MNDLVKRTRQSFKKKLPLCFEKLPDLARDKVYLFLDGQSLHRSRQVCREWNSYILDHIWNRLANRRQLELRLRRNWARGHCEVSSSERRISVVDAVIHSAFDDLLAVTEYEEEHFVTVIKLRSEEEWRIATEGEVTTCQLSSNILLLVTDTHTSEHYQMEVYDLKSKEALIKEDIGPFPDVYCDGHFVLINFGNKFKIIDTKSSKNFVSNRDDNYHLVINFQYPHVLTSSSNLDFVVWDIDISKSILLKRLVIPLDENGPLPSGRIKGCFIEPNLALIHCSEDNILTFVIISEDGQEKGKILWPVDDILWPQNCHCIFDKDHFVVLFKKRQVDEICARIFDIQDILKASTNSELRGAVLNVGSANDFFQTNDRNSKVLLKNKDSLQMVYFWNEVSSIVFKTFNFWATS